jgi:hypothetical protein
MTRAFKTPLKHRLYIAAYYRERYRTDPEYRLRKVNCLRVRQGLPPRKSVEEIGRNGRRDAY